MPPPDALHVTVSTAAAVRLAAQIAGISNDEVLSRCVGALHGAPRVDPGPAEEPLVRLVASPATIATVRFAAHVAGITEGEVVWRCVAALGQDDIDLAPSPPPAATRRAFDEACAVAPAASPPNAAAGVEPEAAMPDTSPQHPAASIDDLPTQMPVFAEYLNHRVSALYYPSTQTLKITSGPLDHNIYNSPTAAAEAVVKTVNPHRRTGGDNGWRFWKLEESGAKLDTLRRRMPRSRDDDTGGVQPRYDAPGGGIRVFALFNGHQIEGVYYPASRRLTVTSEPLQGEQFTTASSAAGAVIRALAPERLSFHESGWKFWRVAATTERLSSIRPAPARVRSTPARSDQPPDEVLLAARAIVDAEFGGHEVAVYADYRGTRVHAMFAVRSHHVRVTTPPCEGKRFGSPSAAAANVIALLVTAADAGDVVHEHDAVTGRGVNGWRFWRVAATGQRLEVLRNFGRPKATQRREQPARPSRGAPVGLTSPFDRSQTSQIKQWARSQGLPVKQRGRVAQAVEDAFYTAHPELTRPPRARPSKPRPDATGTTPIREWIRANGWRVGDYGPLPIASVAAYYAAHPHLAPGSAEVRGPAAEGTADTQPSPVAAPAVPQRSPPMPHPSRRPGADDPTLAAFLRSLRGGLAAGKGASSQTEGGG